MAAPHVVSFFLIIQSRLILKLKAGVVAKILSCKNYNPSQMKSYLQKMYIL